MIGNEKEKRKKTSDQPESQWLLWLSNDGWRNRRSQKEKNRLQKGLECTVWHVGDVYIIEMLLDDDQVGSRPKRWIQRGFFSFLDSDTHTRDDTL
jgi:hypothetical protein